MSLVGKLYFMENLLCRKLWNDFSAETIHVFDLVLAPSNPPTYVFCPTFSSHKIPPPPLIPVFIDPSKQWWVGEILPIPLYPAGRKNMWICICLRILLEIKAEQKIHFKNSFFKQQDYYWFMRNHNRSTKIFISFIKTFISDESFMSKAATEINSRKTYS